MENKLTGNVWNLEKGEVPNLEFISARPKSAKIKYVPKAFNIWMNTDGKTLLVFSLFIESNKA